jgi:hypothetical protein
VSEQPEAMQVPLLERLEDVPADARLAVDDGPHSTSYYPIGKMSHEAAAELRRLHSVNAELVEALRLIAETEWVDAPLTSAQRAVRVARAAIARAEEVKP